MSIKTKLTLFFVAITFISLVLFGAIIFSQARRTLEAVRLAQLNNLADLKKDKIETFFQERKANLKSAQYFHNIKINLPILISLSQQGNNPKYLQAVKELDGQLKPFQNANGFLDVMLTDLQGRIVYVSNDAQSAQYLSLSLPDRHMVEEGKKDIYFSDVFLNRRMVNAFEMFGVAPVKDIRGNFIGEVVIDINMEPIYKFIQDSTGLGETGEAFIDRKEGNEVLFLSPLHHIPDAALKAKAPFNEKKARAAQKAALGETGSGITYDYGGTEVLAAWRYIPSLRWGLVTKIDVVEAFEPVRRLKIIVIAVGAFMILAGVLAAAAIARSLARPIQSLQRGTAIIGSGNFDYKVGTNAKDEVGQLSRLIDSMTENLKKVTASRDELNREIAYRTKAEEEIRKLNSELEARVAERTAELASANKELEAFAYSVSHDLRAPLRSIEGFSLALLEDYDDKLNDTGRDYLSRVRKATLRMGQIIDDLLKLSRVTRSEMNRERVSLSDIVKSIAEGLRHNNPERNVQFLIAPDLTAFGDERLLTLVLENLMSNAWKFSEKASPSVIEFGVTKRDGDSTYFVRDNGAGFDMAYADKLFSPFQRIHTSEEFPGTGIGLATVKRIIGRHGGRVWIEAEAGNGASVFFTL